MNSNKVLNGMTKGKPIGLSKSTFDVAAPAVGALIR